MSYTTPIIEKAEHYVRDFLDKHCSSKMCYHNIDHTVDVVKAAEKIARKSRLDDQQTEIVLLAAWFHDTGYYKGNEDHEYESAVIARNFLLRHDYPEGLTRNVENCIKATKIPQNPQNIMEKVLCDADLYHLSTHKFFKNSELLRKELVAHQCHISPMTWMAKSCEFVSKHKYFTEFARRILKPKKEQNLKKLETKLDEHSSKRLG